MFPGLTIWLGQSRRPPCGQLLRPGSLLEGLASAFRFVFVDGAGRRILGAPGGAWSAWDRPGCYSEVLGECGDGRRILGATVRCLVSVDGPGCHSEVLGLVNMKWQWFFPGSPLPGHLPPADLMIWEGTLGWAASGDPHGAAAPAWGDCCVGSEPLDGRAARLCLCISNQPISVLKLMSEACEIAEASSPVAPVAPVAP